MQAWEAYYYYQFISFRLLEQCITENEIITLEEKICQMPANYNAAVVTEFTKSMESESGNFFQLGMWKLKYGLCPKQTDPHMAKRDKNGTLITSSHLLKN